MDNLGRMSVSGLASAVAIILSIGTLIWSAAVVSAAVSENRRRVELLEASDRIRTDAISRIDARTARIEGKLELILPTSTVKALEIPR